jgi:hypothetical protein
MNLTEWEAKVLQRLIENANPDGVCDPTDLQHATDSILPKLQEFTAGKATGYDDDTAAG